MIEDKKYWVALNTCLEIGAANLYKLAQFFPSMQKAWQATDLELTQAGIKNDLILIIKKARINIDPDKEWKKLETEGIGVTIFKDDNFPAQLKEIPDPPAMLYIKGELKKEDEIAIGVVGTRRMTIYGRQVTEKITSEIARAGVTIVSGLARGVDSVAHETALEIGTRTIAILGCGLDEKTIYPPENLKLSRKILEGRGAIISEFHIGTPPLRHHFPMRNRLISGLSLALLVTECPIKSGALLTARAALEQGKDVFAVPGDIRSKNSEGSNNLIKMGAKAVTEGNEVLEEFNIKTKRLKDVIAFSNREEELILKVLDLKPLSLDKLAKKSGLSVSVAASTLTLMEIKGMVRNIGMNQYVVKH